MNLRVLWLLPVLLALGSCCNRCKDDTVVSQRFIHKYGFGLTEEQWKNREQDGQIVLTRQNGVTETRTYENGVLNGPTTFTYSNSEVLHKIHVYDQGILLKEVEHDANGLPLREEIFEFDNRRIITLWDIKCAPMSIEEYEGDRLVEASYFSPENELESGIEDGQGIRIKRDRFGLLLLKDQITNGALSARKTYHSNGEIESESFYEDYDLHGKQVFYTPTAKLFLEQEWNHGILDGLKSSYREGVKIKEIPYCLGKKHGMEKDFNEDGKTIAEIQWDADDKHGSSRFHDEYQTAIEWYFRGKKVSLERFEMLDHRERMMEEFVQ